MQNKQAYHEAAIIYNEVLAKSAEELAPTLEHDEVRKWCTAVGKQHRHHAKRHRLALKKFLAQEDAPPVEAVADGLDVPEPVEEVVETAPEADGNPALADGCSPYHDPSNPNCEFAPNKETTNG